MKQPKTPQEKKRLSLLKDCQNTYGENDKSSRQSIRIRKSWVNRTYRRDSKQILSEIDRDFDTLNDTVATIDRKNWRKIADTPLGEILRRDKNREVSRLLLYSIDFHREWLDRLTNYLYNLNLSEGRIIFLLRHARALAFEPTAKKLDLDLEDLDLISQFINSL